MEIKKGDIVTWDEQVEFYMQFYGREHGHLCEVVGFEEDGMGNESTAVVDVVGDMRERVPTGQLKLSREDALILMDGLACVLGGQDVALFNLVLCAQRWCAIPRTGSKSEVRARPG